jgi:hypothetical protein
MVVLPEGCTRMPEKIANSTARPHLELPEGLKGLHTSRRPCEKPGTGRFRSHPGNAA